MAIMQQPNLGWFPGNVCDVLGGMLIISVVFFLGRFWGMPRLPWWRGKPNYPVPQDTVLIYGVGRGKRAPSSSPFPLKLETFCRMAKIPYMVDHGHKMSSKGKTPWMLYNGQAVADSQFCIEHLKAQRDLGHLEADLTPLEMAQARAFRELTEENLYWTMCHEFFFNHPDLLGEAVPFGPVTLWLFAKVVGRVLKDEMQGHGIGRHTDQEIWDIGAKDLQALSDFLGDKKYFLGDEPREVDCALFGLLAQITYHMKGTRHEQHVRDHLPNLAAYVERMKERFWPDWEKRCRGGNYVEDEYKLYPASQTSGYAP